MNLEKKLTKRQLEIVCYLANGYTAEETAKELYLSLSTVKKTLYAARKRIGASTTTHLVSLVIAQGVLYWTTDNERSVSPPAQNNGAEPS